MNQSIPCDTVGSLLKMLDGIPQGAFLRINGKKVTIRAEYKDFTVYLETLDEDSNYLFGF